MGDDDGSALLASLLVSLIGGALLVYGKKQVRIPQMVVGAALALFPYFVSNALLILGIALVLCLGLWLAVRWGW